jgi:hypothetical protein
MNDRGKPMNIKRNFWIILVLLFNLLTGCRSAPQRDFSDRDLLIDEQAMPENWEFLESAASKELFRVGELSGARISFQAKNSPYYIVRGGEDIYRYSSSFRAAWRYKAISKSHLTPNIAGEVWSKPDEIEFVSPWADRQVIVCQERESKLWGEFSGYRNVCEYLAQYDEFLISFIITTSVEGQQYITMDEVEKIIEEVDQKVGAYLNPNP